MERRDFLKAALFLGIGYAAGRYFTKETPVPPVFAPSPTPEPILQPKESPTPMPTSTPLPQTVESESARLSRLTLHKSLHYPRVEGKIVPATSYLTWPLDQQTKYDITEGWTYSAEERLIHGFSEHRAVDIAAAYGSSIYAPTDGLVMASYHSYWLRNADGRVRTYQGKPMRFGLGYFIQMYVPSVNRFLLLAHLSDIDKNIPFSMPTKSSDNWNPTNLDLSIARLKKHPMVVEVKRGDRLGQVGISGVGWGYEDYIAGAKRPVKVDPNLSWDETHIHLVEFWRDQATGQRRGYRDPFGIYSTYDKYPVLGVRGGVQMKDPLFILDEKGAPQFSEKSS